MRALHRCLRHGDDQDQPPPGLIGYDTDQAIKARECGTTPPPVRIIRARTLLYVGVIAAVAMTMLYALATRSLMDVSAIHERTPAFHGPARWLGAQQLHPAARQQAARGADLRDIPGGDSRGTGRTDRVKAVPGQPLSFEIGPDQTLDVRLLVTVPRGGFEGAKSMIQIKATDAALGDSRVIRENFFGP